MARIVKRRGRAPTRRPRYANLKAYFRDTGASQRSVALAMRLSQASVSRIATGESVPKPATAERLARYADIPVASFTTEHLKWRQRRGHRE